MNQDSLPGNETTCPVCSKRIYSHMLDKQNVNPLAYFVICRDALWSITHYEYACHEHRNDLVLAHEIMGCHGVELSRSMEYVNDR